MNYLDKLNREQLTAVKHMNGPCLVMAGAGSGKTKVLTSRIAYLIESGIHPYNILAITFTNKAARKMRERVNNIVGETNAFIGTFHSFGLKVIRENPEKINELLKRRNPELTINEIIEIDAQRRKIQAQADELRAKRKNESQKIGMMKKNGKNTGKHFHGLIKLKIFALRLHKIS